MPDPTRKSDAIDEMLTAITGVDRVSRVKDNECVFADVDDEEHSMDFTDELSRKEYTISGLCQTCQDKVFAEPDEEEY
jgi:hypothetical protein